jgi:septal ring factor EnvC (AmiA/AmiB activator)
MQAETISIFSLTIAGIMCVIALITLFLNRKKDAQGEAGQIAVILTEIGAIKSIVEKMESRLENHTERISRHDTDIIRIEQRVNALEEKCQDIKTAVDRKNRRKETDE